MSDDDSNKSNSLAERIRRKVRHKRRARERDEQSEGIWSHLGVFGLVGWSVSLPLLFGLASGIWLDRVLEDTFSWTLAGLIAGVVAGCLNAWYWIVHETDESS
ncbi:MAG: AtpZ/AtpI family protein [Myxococcota bacterium]